MDTTSPYVDAELIERARVLSSSAAQMSRNLDLSQAKYVVSRSIEVKERVKTPRRDIRSYLNDDSDSPVVIMTPSPARSSINTDEALLDTSRYPEVICQCTYPFSMWIAIHSFHVGTGFIPEKIYVDCSTAVDCIIIVCAGVKIINITATDSVGTVHSKVVEITVKMGEDYQRVEIPLTWPTKKILLEIHERLCDFPCVFKISASSAIRASSLSTPIKGSPEEIRGEVRSNQPQQQQPLIMKGYRPASSGGDRAFKAAIHGAAAISRVSTNNGAS